jgi:hypothetical protein
MCVDEEHVRALAYQAAEWHKPGTKPVGSAGTNFYQNKIFFLLIYQ